MAYPMEYFHAHWTSSDGGQADGASSYHFLPDDEELKAKISLFHAKMDGRPVEADSIFVGGGSSPLLASVLMALKRAGLKEVHYFTAVS